MKHAVAPIAAALTTVVVVAAAAEAIAADQLVAGHKLTLRDSGSGRSKAVWLATGANIVAPAAAGIDDPTLVGATLELVAGTGQAVTFSMPASSWQRRRTSYKFRNRDAPAGPSQVRSAVIRDGRIKVRAASTGVSLSTVQGSVGVALTLGSERYCSLFGGTVRRDQPGAFVAKRAVAPPECPSGAGGFTWHIEDGPDEQSETLAAFFAANAGDTIEFGEGAFEFDTTLVMAHREGITIRGQGIDKTVLDFLGSFSPEGISLSHMTGITIEELTVIDTPGFSVKISDSDHVVLRNLRAMWSSADTDPTDGIDDRGGMDPKIPSTLDVTCVRALSFPESTGTYVDASGVTRNYVIDSGNGGYALWRFGISCGCGMIAHDARSRLVRSDSGGGGAVAGC